MVSTYFVVVVVVVSIMTTTTKNSEFGKMASSLIESGTGLAVTSIHLNNSFKIVTSTIYTNFNTVTGFLLAK